VAPDFQLATIADSQGPTAALVLDGALHPLPGRPSVLDLLCDWDASLERLARHAEGGDLDSGRAVEDTQLLPPVLRPPNLYMIGANYADHAREMRGLPPDAEVAKPAGGPFIFLKPTTTLTGHRQPVRLAAGAQRVDWEVELAVVIGRRAERVDTERAIEHVAGYTVANDVSVRGRFVREDTGEAPMRFDWFQQKGWATSCPLGPWLTPAANLPDAQDTRLSLTVNGEVQQESRTSQMIFPIAEQIAFISAIVPLLPGDVICTGTCAGVGAGRGRFLEPGDVMVAEVEGIGTLENPVEETDP
jgi:2-keto-4-pentenoate hydratase/2-oxohepta-3-ene-1,7-dioic acid hydratase in catechol pathway